MADPKSSSAVAVREVQPAEVITFDLSNWPEARFNRLVPTQTVMVTSDLMSPVIQVVKLDDRDTYESPDVPKGNRAIGRTGLRKLATAAAVSILDERRTDDGTNPDVCEVTCLAEMTLPSGQRIRATGMKRVDLRAMKWATDNHRAKFKSFFQEHVASRAQNRAIRALLSLQASYPIAELAKPFAVISYAPNMNHPEVRARVLDAVAPAIAAGFGPEAKQIGPGQVTVVEQVADDEDAEAAAAAAYREHAAQASDTPAWADVLGGGVAAPAKDPGAEARTALIGNLQAKANGSDLEGDASEDQKRELAQKLLGPIGLPAFRAGIQAAWGVVPADDGKLYLTARQAYALIESARHDDLVELWRSAFAGTQAAA